MTLFMSIPHQILILNIESHLNIIKFVKLNNENGEY